MKPLPDGYRHVFVDESGKLFVTDENGKAYEVKAPPRSVFVVERFSILQEMCGAWVFLAVFDTEEDAHVWLSAKILREEEARVVQPTIRVDFSSDITRTLVHERSVRRLEEEFRVREVTVGTNAEQS
jgi:hypothetical protein